MDVQEEALKAGHTPNEPNWGVEPESIWGHVTLDDNGKTVTETIPSEPGRYQDLFQNVYDAIAGGKELIVKPEQARTTIRIIELAFQSSREKRTVAYSD
jgi:scyllo-inositol 2-dehydrogenase (NADP+)